MHLSSAATKFKFEFEIRNSKLNLMDVRYGVGSVECGVWSVENGVGSVE